MRIGFTGATGCLDFGDYAMLINNLLDLDRIGKVDFTIFTYNKTNTQEVLKQNELKNINVSVVDDVLGIMGIKYGNISNSSLSKQNHLDLSEIWSRIYFSLDQNLSHYKPVIEELKKCNILIFNGGGYFNENWSYRIITFAIMIKLADKLNVPVVFFPQTYGPFNEQQSQILTDAFTSVKALYCRDNTASPQILDKLCVPSEKITIGIDDLYFRNPVIDYVESSDVTKDILTIQLTNHIKNLDKSYKTTLSALFDELLSKNIYRKIRFVPYHADYQKESFIYNNIVKEMKYRETTEICDYSNKIKDTIYNTIHDTSVILSMRYHTFLIGLSNDILSYNILIPMESHYSYYKIKNHGLFNLLYESDPEDYSFIYNPEKLYESLFNNNSKPLINNKSNDFQLVRKKMLNDVLFA